MLLELATIQSCGFFEDDFSDEWDEEEMNSEDDHGYADGDLSDGLS